jgi:hypothetical protein
MSISKTVSPKGVLEWVTISGEGKENLSGKLQYVANLVLDPENVTAHKAYIEGINKFWKDNIPKGFKKEPKSLGYYEHKEKTEETDEEGKPIYAPSGKVYLAFKTGTTYKDGSAKAVKIYNSKAKEVNIGEAKIGNGTVGEIAGAMGIYITKDKTGKTMVDAGVTLYLDSIKISKFVEFTQGTAFAADDDEDGWDGSDGAGWEGKADEAKAEEPAAEPAKSGKSKPRL